MYDPHARPPVQPTGTSYPPAQQPGPGYPPAQQPGRAQPPARPVALYIVAGLILLGGLLTFVALFLDHRFLPEMFNGNADAQEILPTFTKARLVVDLLGVVVAIGLLVPTFLGVNWARVLLAVACFVYAVADLGAALGAGFTLVAGRGAFTSRTTRRPATSPFSMVCRWSSTWLPLSWS
jgi:hypothetical protein